MIVKCTHCGKEYNKSLSRVSTNNYCSKECRKEASTIKTKCHTCSKEIEIWTSSAKRSKSGFNFCSKSCATSYNNTLKVGENHPGFVSGVSSSYYRKLAFSTYPNKCNRCSYSEFIEVLQIHHKDHDRTNNDISNLEILCPTCHQVEYVVVYGGTQHKPI